MSFSITLGLIVVLVIGTTAAQYAVESNDTCGQSYNQTLGHIKVSAKSSTVQNPAKKCDWTITPTNGSVFLVAEEFVLNDDDFVTIKDSNGSAIFKLNGKHAPFGIITGKQNITVELDVREIKEQTPPSRKFAMFFESRGCSYNINATEPGSFTSPIYSQNYTEPISCTFKINPASSDTHAILLHFLNFNLQSGKVTIKSENKDVITFDAKNRPVELVSGQPTLEFTIPNTTVAENFTVFYERVSKECSDNIKLDADHHTQSVETPKYDLLYNSFNCHWIVTSDEKTTITVNLTDISLPEGTDEILILDGPNRTCPILATINAASKKDWDNRYIISSGNHLWIAVTSQSVSKTFVSKLTLTQTDKDKRLTTNGTLDVNGDFLYLLEVGPDEQVALLFDNSTVLDKDSFLDFYSGLTKTSPKFTSLSGNDKDLLKSPLIAPGNQMRIEGKGVKQLKGSFRGISKGCYKYAAGNSGTYSVAGNCNSSCAWNIPPSANGSTDEIVLHFSALQLSLNDVLIITKLDNAKTVVANITSSVTVLPDIFIAAKDGVIVELFRRSCNDTNTVIEASFHIRNVCSKEITLTSGGKVDIVSPNYPNQYPLEALCTWTINRPTGVGLIYISTNLLDLASEFHNITILSNLGNSTKELVTLKGTKLPDDILVNSSLIIQFRSPNGQLVSDLKSASGFNISLTFVDDGGNIASSGSDPVTVSFPSNTTSGSIFVWSVSVPAQNSTTLKNIISYDLKNTTKPTDLKSVLTIYDGPSSHDKTVNLTEVNDTNILSRTNTLILMYQRESPNATYKSMQWTFYAHGCNGSLMCKNGVCMHPTWVCNGKDDCGDMSDESNCGGGPGPTPPPTPAPTPTSAGMPVGVLIGSSIGGLVLGLLLATFLPILYRRYKPQDSNLYSSLVSGEPSVFS